MSDHSRGRNNGHYYAAILLVQSISAANRDVPKSPPGPKQDCSDTIHLAFFFDGTGNNRDEDARQQRWSNVARLFDAAMADPSQGIYRFYISGVGTPFNGEVSWVDKPDVWLEDHALGGAFGAGGDRRLADGKSRMNQGLHQALINSARKTGLAPNGQYLPIARPGAQCSD